MLLWDLWFCGVAGKCCKRKYTFCIPRWNAVTFSKSVIKSVKTAYSASRRADRRLPTLVAPKQPNIQLSSLIATLCSIRRHKTPCGRWHLSVRPPRIDVPAFGSCLGQQPRPATQPHHFYYVLRNLLFNTAYYCWHTNLPQHGPILPDQFLHCWAVPFPLILSFQNSYYIGFSYGKRCNKITWRCAQVSTQLLLKSFTENKICFCSKQNCLNVIYFYVPKKIYCEVQHWFRT